MYRTRQVRIKKGNRLSRYSRELCEKSASLYNRANYLVRQYATACRDLNQWKSMNQNQMEVFRMVRSVTRGSRFEPKGQWLNYGQLDYIMKIRPMQHTVPCPRRPTSRS